MYNSVPRKYKRFWQRNALSKKKKNGYPRILYKNLWPHCSIMRCNVFLHMEDSKCFISCIWCIMGNSKCKPPYTYHWRALMYETWRDGDAKIYTDELVACHRQHAQTLFAGDPHFRHSICWQKVKFSEYCNNKNSLKYKPEMFTDRMKTNSEDAVHFAIGNPQLTC